MSRQTSLILFIAALGMLVMVIPFCGTFYGHDVSNAAGNMAHLALVFSVISCIGIWMSIRRSERTALIQGIVAVNIITCLLVGAVWVYVFLAILNNW